jgi:hypothetical protein
MHTMRGHNKSSPQPLVNCYEDFEVASDSEHRKLKSANNSKKYLWTPIHVNYQSKNKVIITFILT